MDGTDLGIPGISGATEVGRTPATTTYRATDASGRPVVVKVLNRDATPEVRARFDYDQARLSELDEHPNIVTVLGYGYTASNQPYVVNEVLDAGTMADKVGGGLDGPGVLDLGIRVAGALESAHRRDVVHGDLRPEDIRVDASGEPKVADFGVAMVTGFGPDRATTPDRLAHAAPEQLHTHVPTPASDVYALGSVLYALLGGGPAFVRPADTSVAGVGARILNEAPPDLRTIGVPDPVVDAIERAMQKDPAQRWSSAEAFGLALQQAEVTLGLPISPMIVLGQPKERVRPAETEDVAQTGPATAAPAPKNRLPLILGAVAAVLVLAVGGFLLLGGDDGGDEEDEARQRRERDPAANIELEEVSDDSGTITVGVIEAWSDVDGRPLSLGDGTNVPDLIAAADADSFLADGGFQVSGIEVTIVEDAVDAAGLLDDRVSGRNLANQCTTDLPPAAENVAGFVGLLQRFEGCDGSKLAVFAGISGGRGLVVEVHLVEPEDEAALQDVLDSISVQ